MTSRILAALLAVALGLLLGALLPLGFAMAGQYAHDYREGTLGLAHTLAAAAEERLADREDSTMLEHTLAQLRRTDDSRAGLAVAAVDDDGHLVTETGSGVYTAQRAAPGLAGRDGLIRDGDRLIASVPVSGHGERISGAVVLSRSLQPLDARTDRLWTSLAAVAAAAVAAATVLAIALARWVGRPLRRLETAAESLGAGRLDARAAPPKRPPEVRRLTQRFNVMAARLQTLVRGNRTMLADVSHQLRTPLAALRLRLELLADDPDPAEFDAALDELARLSRLVDGLLAMSRAEDVTPIPEPVDVTALLRERAAAWRPVAAERDVTLDVEHDSPLAALAGPGHLEQAIDNLIDNALSVTPGGGAVRLSARRAAGRVHIRVADTGPGMTDDAKRHAFHRFRGDRATGTGLGLAIVHRLVNTDGGRVTLDDTPGGGLTVVLDLPEAR